MCDVSVMAFVSQCDDNVAVKLCKCNGMLIANACGVPENDNIRSVMTICLSG